MLRRLLSPFVPPTCWSCGAGARHGDPLCASCDAALPWLGEGAGAAPLAQRPGARRARGGTYGDAAGAAAAAGMLDALWTPLAFEGPARDLVHALKFRGVPALATPMARDMLDGAPRDLLAAPVAIVPVPAHPWRRRARGFDHADVLAQALADATGRPVLRALERGGGPSAHQRGLPRARRLAGEGLTVRARGDAVPRAAVLVDDVCTTGATLSACAAALRASGASSVSAIVYARAL